MRTAVRKLRGHAPGGPSAVVDQSFSRINEASSLDPANSASSEWESITCDKRPLFSAGNQAREGRIPRRFAP